MQPSAPLPTLDWGVPFVGLLVSIAVVPIVAPRFWHRRLGFVAFAWSALSVIQQAAAGGLGMAAAAASHAILAEYLPFITMLLALYTAGGGVLLRGGPGGTPLGNTALLAIGMAMGAVMGTTAASMVLIHPLLRANAHRRRKVHFVLFLIVLVANASGAITPLGNPPLYIGLLHGVPFFWPLHNLYRPLLVVAGILLTTFYLIDSHLAASEPFAPPRQAFRVRGWANIALILLVIVIVLGQGFSPAPSVVLAGQAIDVGRFAVMGVCLAATATSARTTARAIRQANDFSWHPIAEVAMLFAAIFITIGPVVAMLQAGLDGPLAPMLRLAQDNDGKSQPLVYFWLTGLLSAFLDNAPTYLVFFELAGIHPASLSGHQGEILAAISAGAVLFGGLTYIGNAPNMMLRAIAAHRGVRMPGFFGYMLMASGLLLPVLGVVTLLFFI